MININNKEWSEIKLDDIQQLLSEDNDESFFFEYKEDDIEPHKLIKEISAFANTYGGYVIIGVNDNKEIVGCTKWTEHKISNVIHDSLSPTPVFDIKCFNDGNSKIIIIKIEEGADPPYITGKGYIYERVSSGSFPIKESYKLTHLYEKRKDNIKILERKILIDDIPLTSLPANLCATLDIGFSIKCSEPKSVYDSFLKASPEGISDLLKVHDAEYSITKLGNSYFISFGKLSGPKTSLIPANLHQFIEIMADGSSKLRIPLYSMGNDDSTVDCTRIISIPELFKNIYSLFFGNLLELGFIYAYRYERLNVYRQFIPFIEDPKIENPLNNHALKYGNNIIVTGNRHPKNDFELIDMSSFDFWGIPYNDIELKKALFEPRYSHIGYIDDFVINP